MDVLIINNHDYTGFVRRKGVRWKRVDIDQNSAQRTLDGKAHRGVVVQKRSLTYELMDMTQAELAQLDDDLSAQYFQATYLDVHGVMTKTFFCEQFSAVTDEVDDTSSYWTGASFTMEER